MERDVGVYSVLNLALLHFLYVSLDIFLCGSPTKTAFPLKLYRMKINKHFQHFLESGKSPEEKKINKLVLSFKHFIIHSTRSM